MMNSTRFIFEKKDTAIWISHLDLMHTLQRAFTRAGIDIVYSEGFNPHPQMSIALPLGVGTESECEVLDIKITKDCSIDHINKFLPLGIKVKNIYIPERKASEIKWLEIEGTYENSDDKLLLDLFDREEIVISKKTKRGISDVDIKPMIKSILFNNGKLNAVISAQEPTLNPNNIFDAVKQLTPENYPDNYRFKRIQIYDSNMRVFR